MSKIKILHVTSVHPRDDTRISYRECKCLAENPDYEVTLLVFDGKENTKEFSFRIADGGNLHCHSFLARIMLGFWRTLSFCIKNKPNIVHLHDPELIFIGGLLSRLGYIVVYDVHENVVEDIATKDWLPVFFRKVFQKIFPALENFLMLNSSVILAETSYLENYSKFRSVTVLRNFPEVDILSERVVSKKRNKFTVCYIGAISVNRGFYNYLSALEKMRDIGSDVRFLCIGKAPKHILDCPRVVSAINSGWLEMTGRLAIADAVEQLSSCHVGLSVLSNEGNFSASYPTKIFEYMSMSLPVVCSNFPLYKSIVLNNDCGLVVKPDDSNQLSQTLIYCEKNLEKLLTFGNNGLLSVKESYSWSNEKINLINLYQRLTS